MFLLYVINLIGTNSYWVSCVGPGARLVVKLSGGGGSLLCGGPLSHYLGYTLNGHFLCWGGNVTFDVYRYGSRQIGGVSAAFWTTLVCETATLP